MKHKNLINNRDHHNTVLRHCHEIFSFLNFEAGEKGLDEKRSEGEEYAKKGLRIGGVYGVSMTNMETF